MKKVRKLISSLTLLSVLFFLAYLCFIYFFYWKGVLLGKDAIGNLTVFFGWIIALGMGFVHLKKSRKDSQLNAKEVLKKELQINAFKEINAAVTVFSSILSTVGVSYVSLPGNIDLHLKFSHVHRINKIELQEKFNQGVIQIYDGTAKRKVPKEFTPMKINQR